MQKFVTALKLLLLLVLIKVFFFSEVSFTVSKSSSFVEQYNINSEAGFVAFADKGEGPDDLEKCRSSHFKPGDPVSLGYLDGCKAAILGKSMPKLISLNPLNYF